MSWINCLKSEKGRHHLVPLHLNLFVKLSIILSAGGYLLMIDAAPLNVMDECYTMGRAESPPPPPPPPPPLTTTLSARRRRAPCVHRWRNKGAFNLSPINNVQLRRPFGERSPVKAGPLLCWSNSFWLVYYLRICTLSHVWYHYFTAAWQRHCDVWEPSRAALFLRRLQTRGAGEYVKRKIRGLPSFFDLSSMSCICTHSL